MNTLRAHLGADTALVVWLRDDSGKITFATDDVVRVFLYAYGCPDKVEEAGITPTFAVGTTGRLAFTVTEEYADANLSRGVYRFAVARNGAQAMDGLLEVV